jgi:hypothetical protein
MAFWNQYFLIVTCILRSDHGMAAENPNGNILITSYLNESMIDTKRSIYGIVSNIFARDGFVSFSLTFLRPLFFKYISKLLKKAINRV